MKIAILGPVITPNYYGGVASFDMSLAEAFNELGHSVDIFTSQSLNGSNVKRNIKIHSLKKQKIASFINKENFDIVIASLQYGTVLKRIKIGKRIYFLHGFFNFESYGVLKTLLATYLVKQMVKHCDVVLANSEFTSMINKRIWNIQVDGVVHLGVNSEYLQKVLTLSKIHNKNNKKILFLGRLAKSKQVDKIVEAMALLKDKSYELTIAGDGPELQNLKKLANSKDINVKFIGRIDHSKVYELCQDSDIFISLGESEPYGITYVEALLAGCKIICPITGGQVEYLSKYKDRVEFVNCSNVKNISLAIERLFKKNVKDINSNVATNFSYKLAVQQIITIMHNKEK